MKKMTLSYSKTAKKWQAVFRAHPGENGVLLFERKKQADAEDAAEIVGRILEVELFLYRKKGGIRDRRSYGNDPRGNG